MWFYKILIFYQNDIEKEFTQKKQRYIMLKISLVMDNYPQESFDLDHPALNKDINNMFKEEMNKVLLPRVDSVSDWKEHINKYWNEQIIHKNKLKRMLNYYSLMIN